MLGSFLVNGSLWKGKYRPFDEHFDYILKLANHGVFHAKPNLVYRNNLIVAISDEAWDKLKTQTLKSGFANGFTLSPVTMMTKIMRKQLV